MAEIEKHALVPHPAAQPRRITAVSVRVSVHPSHLWLGYAVQHENALLLPDTEGRQDGLWRNTCFELFVKPSDAARYREYNFAPFAAWAAYDFHCRRHGMTQAIVTEPHLVDGRIEDRAQKIDHLFEFCVVVQREGLLVPDGLTIGLTAVIEEIDGTKSYWALAHGDPDRPDFHDPACFTLRLPATG